MDLPTSFKTNKDTLYEYNLDFFLNKKSETKTYPHESTAHYFKCQGSFIYASVVEFDGH